MTGNYSSPARSLLPYMGLLDPLQEFVHGPKG